MKWFTVNGNKVSEGMTEKEMARILILTDISLNKLIATLQDMKNLCYASGFCQVGFKDEVDNLTIRCTI